MSLSTWIACAAISVAVLGVSIKIAGWSATRSIPLVSHPLSDAITHDATGTIGIGTAQDHPSFALPLEEHFLSTHDSAPSVTTSTPSWAGPPAHTLTFQAPDGRQAHLDFSGDRVAYSGDLPVEDSVRLFFDAFAFFRQTECGRAQP